MHWSYQSGQVMNEYKVPPLFLTLNKGEEKTTKNFNRKS